MAISFRKSISAMLLAALSFGFCSCSVTAQEPKTFTNSIGMKLVLIPAGTFTMGRPPEEIGLDYDFDMEEGDGPHLVTLTSSFQIATTEVTVAQFRAFAEETNYKTEAERGAPIKMSLSVAGQTTNASESGGMSMKEVADVLTDGRATNVKSDESRQTVSYDMRYTWKNPGIEQSERDPVVYVSWNDAVAFCHWLSNKEGCTYRLPTEAEWEYACRAGSTKAYWFGENGDDALDCLWCVYNSKGKTQPVGTVKANPFGLYDMYGNVSEWCQDWWGPYAQEPETDPQGPSEGGGKIHRGGNWYKFAEDCRSSARDCASPSFVRSWLGFRIVRVQPAQ